MKGCASDVVLLSPHDVPNPSPSPSHDDDRWMMILARILLGTDSKVIPRDLLQFEGTFLRNLHNDSLRPIFMQLLLLPDVSKERLK